MALQASLPEEPGRFTRRRLVMGIVAVCAPQLSSTVQVTLAELHVGIILNRHITMRDGGCPTRDVQKCQDLDQRNSGPDIVKALSRLQDAGICSLVTIHADLVGHPCWKPGGVDNGGVYLAGNVDFFPSFIRIRPLGPFFYVQLPWSMAVFAAH